jgi:hypothetical protein
MSGKEIAELAPIATALIALAAAYIAWRALNTQKDIARRRAAIDFFLKTEMDEKIIEMYKAFKIVGAGLDDLGEQSNFADTNAYHVARTFLNICELIAVGINEGAFSERVSYVYWGDVIPQTYRSAAGLISRIRHTPGEGTLHTYKELERVSKRWTPRWWQFRKRWRLRRLT